MSILFRKAAALQKKIYFPKVNTDSPVLFHFVPLHLHLSSDKQQLSACHILSQFLPPFCQWEETELLSNHGLAQVLHAVPQTW